MSAFWIPVAVLVITFIAGLPVAYDLIAAGVVYLLVCGMDIGIIAEQICQQMFNNYTILAVPMFILMANIMNGSTVANKMFAFCKAFVGNTRGALAQVNVVNSVIFAGMSGSAVADAGGMGALETNAMKEDGYPADFAAALSSATSTVGPIIPPSIPMVIYATLSGVSVGGLFLAGIVPGLLLAGALSLYVAYVSKKRNYPRGKKYTFKEFLKFTWGALPALFTIVVLFAGIYGGVMTPTEAGAMASLWAIFVAATFYRSLTLKDLWIAIRDTALSTGQITIMTAASVIMSYMVAKEGVSQAIAAWILGVTTNKYVLLAIINVIFIVLGMFLDVSVLQYVFVPLILPVVSALGIDLTHFGVIIVLNMMIGLSTPPFGMCLFISSAVSGAKLSHISREILPMVAMMIAILIVLTYVPSLVTFLPALLGF